MYWAWELLPAQAQPRVSSRRLRRIRLRPHHQPRRLRRQPRFPQLWLPHPLLRSLHEAIHLRPPPRSYRPPRLLSRGPPFEGFLFPNGHPSPQARTAAPREMLGRLARCSSRATCAPTPPPASTGCPRREDASCASAGSVSSPSRRAQGMRLRCVTLSAWPASIDPVDLFARCPDPPPRTHTASA